MVGYSSGTTYFYCYSCDHEFSELGDVSPSIPGGEAAFHVGELIAHLAPTNEVVHHEKGTVSRSIEK